MTKVAFTRPADRIEESVKFAESMGLEVMAAPSLEIYDGDPKDFREAAKMIADGKVSFVVFGSGTGVERCHNFFGDAFSGMFGGVTVVAIGPNTKAVLERRGVNAEVMPEDYSSYGIVDILGASVAGKEVLLVRSDMGSEVLKLGLEKNGATVKEFAAYRLRKVGMTEELEKIMDAMQEGGLDALAFTSPMSAESFLTLLENRHGKANAASMLKNVCVAAIGKPTAMKLTALGRVPDIVPALTTFADMLEAIKEKFEGNK